jgi:hypothetical protein
MTDQYEYQLVVACNATPVISSATEIKKEDWGSLGWGKVFCKISFG